MSRSQAFVFSFDVCMAPIQTGGVGGVGDAGATAEGGSGAGGPSSAGARSGGEGSGNTYGGNNGGGSIDNGGSHGGNGSGGGDDSSRHGLSVVLRRMSLSNASAHVTSHSRRHSRGASLGGGSTGAKSYSNLSYLEADEAEGVASGEGSREERVWEADDGVRLLPGLFDTLHQDVNLWINASVS
jgi:hypothetical protein